MKIANAKNSRLTQLITTPAGILRSTRRAGPDADGGKPDRPRGSSPQLNTTIIAARGRDDGEQGHHVRHQKQQQRADQHAEAGEQQAAHRNAGTARQDTKLPVRMLSPPTGRTACGCWRRPRCWPRTSPRSAPQRLITAAAAGSPALANSVTKGLVSTDTPPRGDSDDHHHRQQIEDDNPQRQSIDRLAKCAADHGLRRHGAQQLNAGKGEDRYLKPAKKSR